jgi:hypothetical protein
MFDKIPTSTSTSAMIPATEPTNIRNIGDIKRVYYIDQIFDPDVHPATDIDKYIVPLEGEIVVDTHNRRFYEVSHVDRNNTWKSTLVVWSPISTDTTTDYNLFPKSEYGFLQGELALMIDFSARPPVARVDSNATAPNAAYALLYKGDTIGNAGQIISATYSGNTLINSQITVAPVVYDNVENLTVQGANSFSVTMNEAELPNGTRCTLVYYDQGGIPIPQTYPVVVQQSGYLRDHQLDKRYVTSIELVAPWFTNSTLPDTMFVPINLALSAVEFRAIVHYNDGASVEHPVNSYNGNNGFRIDGLDQYKPTAPGQISDEVVLTYFFAEGEQAMIVQPGAPRHMSNVYQIQATPAEGAYSPRIYTYPYWDPASGYKLKHFLTDLDRKYCRDVTDKVTLNNQSPVFAGQKYNEEQSLIFNLNLRDVAAIYEPWSFVQETTVTLYNQATSPTATRMWDVRHSYLKPAFNNLFVEFWPLTGGTNPCRFGGITSTADFLAKGYTAFEPIYDPRQETQAPTPTHFDLIRSDGVTKTAIPIASFGSLPIADMTLIAGQTLFIRWTRREASGSELQLGVSAAVCKQIANPNP